MLIIKVNSFFPKHTIIQKKNDLDGRMCKSIKILQIYKYLYIAKKRKKKITKNV